MGRRTLSKRAKAQRAKKIKKVILVFLLIVILSAATYFGYLYFKTKNTLEDIYVPIISNSNEQKASKEKPIEEKVSVEKPISVLLLGVDGEGNKGSRSDTMIVMTMNPTTGKTTMLSIPRDSRTEIVGKGKDDKITHAHAFGGPQMAIDTVENLLDIQIDYFASVDMKGFKEVVDIFDGVTVTNDLAFSYDGHTFAVGEITLNGEEALAYARMRKEDPRGDLGRNDRQKQIIEALMSKAAKISSVSKVEEILDMVGNNVRTNAQLSDMSTLQQYYAESNEQTEVLNLTGYGQKINGIWYFILDETVKQQVKEKLKEELSPETVTKENFVY